MFTGISVIISMILNEYNVIYGERKKKEREMENLVVKLQNLLICSP